MNDLYEVQKSFPTAQYRYLQIPSEAMPTGLKMLRFANETTYPYQELGMKDAADTLEKGEGYYW